MKNVHGLIIALALGVAGALLNWAYLSSASRQVEMVDYIGIMPDVTIGRGEQLLGKHFEKVPIPKNRIGNLDDYAIRWADLSSAIANRNAARTLNSRSLLLEDDVKTAPTELRLKKTLTPKDLEEMGLPLDADAEEVALFVPVDTRTFVSALINPGDEISFLLPSGVPTRAEGPRTPEMIGPFRVLSIGNRLSSPEVMKASKIPAMQQNVITVRAARFKSGQQQGQLDGRSKKLEAYKRASSHRGLGVILHP